MLYDTIQPRYHTRLHSIMLSWTTQNRCMLHRYTVYVFHLYYLHNVFLVKWMGCLWFSEVYRLFVDAGRESPPESSLQSGGAHRGDDHSGRQQTHSGGQCKRQGSYITPLCDSLLSAPSGSASGHIISYWLESITKLWQTSIWHRTNTRPLMELNQGIYSLVTFSS